MVLSGETDITYFPRTVTTPGPGLPAMYRVTLRSTLTPTVPYGWMTLSQAQSIFVGLDDLEYELPVTSEDDAHQKLDRVAGGTGAFVRRNARGRFSWFATLVPELSTTVEDDYVLSVIVVKEREFALDPQKPNELMIPLNPQTDFGDAGLGGGDVTMRVASDDPVVNARAYIRTGDWVLLAQQVASGTGVRNYFRWYHVINTDDYKAGTDRTVMLSGPDWNPNVIGPAPGNLNNLIWVKNVVAVYEKMIRLEAESVWTES